MLIYIIRHGETELNRLGIVQGSGMDTELNATGHAQAAAFHARHQHINFQLVVTSALRRTHQTVQPFLLQHIPWVQRADLNEISWGQHEGQAPTPEHLERYERMIASWKCGDLQACLPGGETAQQLLDRVQRFVDWLKQLPEARILVATHGRTLRCLVALLKGWPPGHMEQVPHANTGLYVLRLRDGHFEFLVENDTSHLR